MKICTVFLLLFITGSGFASSPSQIDSLEDLLNTATGTERIKVQNSLSYMCGMRSPGRCIELASQALELAKKRDDREGMFYAYRSLAKGYHFSNDFNAVLEHTQEALTLAKELDRHEDIAYTLLLMAHD